MWAQQNQNHREDAMPDQGGVLTKWGTSFGLNRSALDDETEDLDEEFGDAALGISRSEQCSWDGRPAAVEDNESFCVVVGARVPLRQLSPHRRRNRSPGRYHASPGRSSSSDGRYLSPGRFPDIPHSSISPGRPDHFTGRHPQSVSQELGHRRLEDTGSRHIKPNRPHDVSTSRGSSDRNEGGTRTWRSAGGGGGEDIGRREVSAGRRGDTTSRDLAPCRGISPRRAEHNTNPYTHPATTSHSAPSRHEDAARDANWSTARDPTRRYASPGRNHDAAVKQSSGGSRQRRDRSSSGSRIRGSGTSSGRSPDYPREADSPHRARSLHRRGDCSSTSRQPDPSQPSGVGVDGQRGACQAGSRSGQGQPSSPSYEKLEEEWTLYASQQDLRSVGVRSRSSSSSQTLLRTRSSSGAGQRMLSGTPLPDSSTSRCKLPVRDGYDGRFRESAVRGLEEGEGIVVKRWEASSPPASEQAGVSSSCAMSDQFGSGSLCGDDQADSGGYDPPLVSSLRRRSKSTSDRLDDDEVPRSRPSKSVHFSIFPYVRQIPARQKTSSMGSSRGISSLVTPERSGRTRSRIGVSQSQPGSRSTSPSSRGSYLTHIQPGRDPMTPKGKRKSGIPRSQGTSRETSPNRHTYGRERRLSGSKVHPGTGLMSRVLRPGSDVEDALNDALSRPQRKRYDIYDSDDAASETSSVCSERSYTSYSGRTSEDMSEIIALLGSGSYTERKDGLISLQHLLRSSRYLSRVELKKVTEVFTRMFHDPHSKVFSIFLDTLTELCLVHGRDLTDWLYVLLTRLLNKTGTEMLGSVNTKLLRTLDTVRDTFPCDSQFNTITKFIIDQTQSPNLKDIKQQVKISMLNFLHGLVMVMEPSDFVNSMDTRLAVSRIINWTMEPRNVDVRKSAQLVLIGLFNLNPPEFSLLLAALPKAFQDGATKILHSHMRSASECTSDVLSPRNATSPVGQQRSRPPSRQSVGQPEECETENMNPEDIYNSIKKTSADIQNLSLGTKLDGYDDIKKKLEYASQDSGIQELRNDSPDGLESRRGNLHMYNPQHYQEETGLNRFGKSLLAQDSDTASYEKEPSMSDVLRELSNHNERVKERRKMLDTLLKWVRNNGISEEQWDEHFKSILLILIETFNDTDKTMRMDALIVFRSILKRQAARFKDYAELTILKVCEAHKDPSKDVQRAAEECALVIPTAISPEQALPILNNIIHTAKFPIHWAAIKMQVEVVKLVSAEVLERSLPNTVPGLIMGYDDSDSRVRKAAVFCLVNVYIQVGESLRPYLADLNSSKTKLLNLYIKRAQEDSRSGMMSPAASDT